MEWGARSCTLLLLCLNGALSSSRVVDEATNAMVELQGTLLELQSDAKAEANDSCVSLSSSPSSPGSFSSH